jgi:hypothetical protein
MVPGSCACSAGRIPDRRARHERRWRHRVPVEWAWDSAGLRKFIWDGENILLQTDSGGTTNRDYIWVREGEASDGEDGFGSA